jgi:hypothetical protein
MVVWSLSLPTGSEGPSLIPCAARLLSVGHHGLPSAPSWRTVIGVADKRVPALLQFLVHLIEEHVRQKR